jgi:hypothetical protein
MQCYITSDVESVKKPVNDELKPTFPKVVSVEKAIYFCKGGKVSSLDLKDILFSCVHPYSVSLLIFWDCACNRMINIFVTVMKMILM